MNLSKNPTATICVKAVIELLTNGTPLLETIHTNKDIRDFVVLRKVTGGAKKDGADVGKVVRFYYSRNEKSPMLYRKSGNKVPKSDGAKAVMNLPAEFPKDLSYKWYVAEAQSLLIDIGEGQGTLFGD